MNRVVILSFVLGLAGAALDFLSAYMILVTTTMGTDSMGMLAPKYNPFDLAAATGLLAMGVLLVASSLYIISSISMKRMSLFGKLMAIYGVIMLLIGGVMASGAITMASGYIYSSSGMFIVGILMIVNAFFMLRRPAGMYRKDLKDPKLSR